MGSKCGTFYLFTFSCILFIKNKIKNKKKKKKRQTKMKNKNEKKKKKYPPMSATVPTCPWWFLGEARCARVVLPPGTLSLVMEELHSDPSSEPILLPW